MIYILNNKRYGEGWARDGDGAEVSQVKFKLGQVWKEEKPEQFVKMEICLRETFRGGDMDKVRSSHWWRACHVLISWATQALIFFKLGKAL